MTRQMLQEIRLRLTVTPAHWTSYVIPQMRPLMQSNRFLSAKHVPTKVALVACLTITVERNPIRFPVAQTPQLLHRMRPEVLAQIFAKPKLTLAQSTAERCVRAISVKLPVMHLHPTNRNQPVTLRASLVRLHLLFTYHVHLIRVRVVLPAGDGLRQKLQLLATFRFVVRFLVGIALVQAQLLDRFVARLARATLERFQLATDAAFGVRSVIDHPKDRVATRANPLGAAVRRLRDRLVADRDGVGVRVV